MLKLSVTFLAFISLHLISYLDGTAQCAAKEEAEAFLSTLHRHHIAPLENSAANHQSIIYQYIQLVDPVHVLYSENDAAELLEHCSTLLDTTGKGICAIIPIAATKHLSKIKQFQTELEMHTAKKLVFNLSDTLQWIQGLQSPKLPISDEDRLDFLRKKINLFYLLDAEALYSSSDSTATAQELKTYINTHDQALREKVKQSMACRVVTNELWKDENAARSAVLSFLFEAIAIAHDPHTKFFNSQAIQRFISNLQSVQIDYGITIDENERDDKIISSLRPGSEAWRSNQIHIDDKVVGIWLDKKALEGLQCMSADEVETAINFGEHKTITLELKTPSGESIKVTLKPEVAESEENLLTSMVLKKDQYKVGYIALPAFYSSSYEEIDNGCANDVGKEIMKLKKDSIQGLILDLRFNGGGSMQEAIDLAGLFIDVGPIGIQQMRTGKPAILKEMSKGVVYDGPLIILVNCFSASASEVIAGALQDYHRALIVGHTTYGKGTSQIILPILTDNEILKNEPNPLGYLKVTTAGIYRITNSTHQGIGIIPDITLPNPLVELNYQEKNETNPVQLQAISKNLIYTPFKPLPLEELQKQTDIRIGNSTYFTELVARKKQWPQLKYPIPLHPDEIQKSIEQAYQYGKLLDEIEPNIICPFDSEVPTANQQLTGMDANLSEWFNQQRNNVQYDAELQECFNIAIDLIQITLN
jgi:carboxyl-terminal processing protease